MKKSPDTALLKTRALEARKALIRAAAKSRSAHIGSSLSQIDITTVLYSSVLNIAPKSADDPERDRFFFSKGHAALGYYAVLAQHGFITAEELETFGEDGTKLAGHPVYRSAPGIESTSGSLGHGLPMAVGVAIAHKRAGTKARCFVLLSDGELDEGSNWEALLLAGHFKLDNLSIIIDYNKIQSFGTVKEVLDLEPLAQKFESCNWSVREVDGHDIQAMIDAFGNVPQKSGMPSAFIAHTVKGKGIKKFENTLASHYANIRPEDVEATLNDLSV